MYAKKLITLGRCNFSKKNVKNVKKGKPEHILAGKRARGTLEVRLATTKTKREEQARQPRQCQGRNRRLGLGKKRKRHSKDCWLVGGSRRARPGGARGTGGQTWSIEKTGGGEKRGVGKGCGGESREAQTGR